MGFKQIINTILDMAPKDKLNLGNIIKYKNVQGKLKAPIDNYILKLIHAHEVLSSTFEGIKPFLKKHKEYEENDSEKINQLRLEAIKLNIIASVTSLEVYFKDLFINIINIKENEPNFLNQNSKLYSELKNTKLSLYDFYITYRKHKVTLSDVLAQNTTYLDITKTNSIFSDLIGENFIENINKVKFKKNNKIEELQEIYPNYMGTIDSLIQFRHQVVHQIDFNLDSEINNTDFLYNYFLLLYFGVAIDHYLKSNLGKKHLSTKHYKDYINLILTDPS